MNDLTALVIAVCELGHTTFVSMSEVMPMNYFVGRGGAKIEERIVGR